MKVTIQTELHDKVKEYAAASSLTQGEVVNMILDDFFMEKKLAATLKTIVMMQIAESEGLS